MCDAFLSTNKKDRDSDLSDKFFFGFTGASVT